MAAWQCVRSTSYIFPAAATANNPLTPDDAQAYQDAGFEIALHLRVSGPNTGPEECNDFALSGGTSPGLGNDLTTQLAAFHSAWPGLAAPVTSRKSLRRLERLGDGRKAQLQHGIRFDTNYYYWPAAFVQNTPGMFTGSGFPMRFADEDGSLIDVYQAATQLTDESGMDIAEHIRALLAGRVRQRLLRRFHRQHAHRHAGQRQAPTTSSAAAQRPRRADRVREADADLARRP